MSKVALKLNLLVMAGSLRLASCAELLLSPDGSHLSCALLPLCLVHLCTTMVVSMQ